MGKCPICAIIKLLAGIGALNWGLVAFFNVNLVAMLLGDMTLPARIVYGLVAVAGIIVLITIVKSCPCCNKSST